MPIITLTTDFGTKDGFVGVLKGVVWSFCPTAQIADISHEISPQNILEGAFALWRAYAFFPTKTVHLAVVDPGVGTSRRPIAVRMAGHTFVGPDNGLFTPMYEDAEKNGWKIEIVHLTKENYFLPAVSHTFHGRDIFAPVAAHLANGVALSSLGSFVTDPVRLSLPMPEKTVNGWRAHITVVDIFGNCTTDLPASSLKECEQVTFHLRGKEVRGMVTSYGEKTHGALIALVDSENFIEIAMVNGNAAQTLGAQLGDVVDVVINGCE
jgi:S-adenosyl-L-methionine hydrolase (adenosine-forming)